MTHIQIYRLPFGGMAFEPLTDQGRAWCHNVQECNPDYEFFHATDGCMTGFSNDAFGIEPYDIEAFLDDLHNGSAPE